MSLAQTTSPRQRMTRLPLWWHRVAGALGTGGVVAAAFLVVLVCLAVLAPLLAPYTPDQQDLINASSSPSWQHLLGTDNLGRDLLSRLMWGARPSLLGPAIVIVAATAVAVPLAVLSGWRGGRVDLVIGRALDLIFAFPGVLLSILVVALWGPGLLPCAFSLAVAYMPWIARVVRSGVIRERNKPYIGAAEVQGVSGLAICLRHLAPNVSGLVWSQATICFGYALIDLAALSFLGLNIQPPRADWGVMTANQNALLAGDLWQILAPCLLIVLCVTSVTYLGNQLASKEDRR
jgi:peptide/nickel transport system permease protein